MNSDRLLLVAQPQLNKYYLPYSMFQHQFFFTQLLAETTKKQ